MSETKAKPVLFSGPMARAILDGRKSQTRRVVNPQPELPVAWCHHSGWAEQCPDGSCTCRPVKPKYLVGEQLWVRETWCPVPDRAPVAEGAYHHRVFYRADNDRPLWANDVPWRPSIFMPRWASRITLEVTEVRCERLHDLSDADRIAEGLPSLEAFRDLWQKLNGKKHPWETNPWCWVYTFRRVPNAPTP